MSTTQVSGVVKVCLWMLFAVIIAAPLLLGGVHWQVALALAVILVLNALVLAREKFIRIGHFPRITPFSAALFGAALWTAIQNIPWPVALLTVLDPGRVELYSKALESGLLEQGSSWLVPSLDPGATASMSLRFLALAAAVWSVENLPSSVRRSNQLLVVVGMSSLISLLVGVVSVSVSNELFFGLYEAERNPVMGSTFVNGNQAAALSLVGTFVWVVLATSRGIKLQRYRLLFGILASLNMAGVALQHSDGMWVLGGALSVICGLYYALSKKGAMRSVAARVMTLALLSFGWLCAWGVGFYVRQSSEYTGRDSVLARVEMVSAALNGSVDFGVFGSGAWSMERGLSPYLQWDSVGLARIETIEAEWIEWTMTLGWPAWFLLSAMLLVSWGGPLFVTRFTARRGASLIGIGFLALTLAQLHFPFFMIGLGIPLMVAWTSIRERTLATRYKKSTVSDENKTQDHPRKQGGLSVVKSFFIRGLSLSSRRALVGASVGLVVVMGVSCYRVLGEPGRVMKDDIEALKGSELRELAQWMPSEPKLYVQYAHELERREESDVKAWLPLYKRAEELEPTPPYQTLYARALWLSGRHDEAQERFNMVIQRLGHMAYPKALMVMLSTIPEPEVRAKVLSSATPDVWKKATVAIEKVEGQVEAQAFLQELTLVLPRDIHAHEQLLRYYVSHKQWALVQMNLSLLAFSSMDDEVMKRDVLVDLEIGLLLSQGKQEDAMDYIHSHRDIKSPSFARYVVQLTEGLIARQRTGGSFTKNELLELFKGSHLVACMNVSSAHPLSKPEALNCQRHRAWVLEYEDRIDDAERAWARFAEEYARPDDLGAFYERQARCTSLRLQVKQMKAEKSKESLIKRLESRYKRCSSLD